MGNMRAEANDFVTSHRRRNDMSPFFIVPPAVKLHKKTGPGHCGSKKGKPAPLPVVSSIRRRFSFHETIPAVRYPWPENQYSSSLKYVFLRGYQSHPLTLCDFGDSYSAMKSDETPTAQSLHHVNYHSNKSFKEPIYTCKGTKKMDNRKVSPFLFGHFTIKLYLCSNKFRHASR